MDETRMSHAEWIAQGEGAIRASEVASWPPVALAIADGKLRFMEPLPPEMTCDEALQVAARIALLVDPGGQKFKAIIKAIQEA